MEIDNEYKNDGIYMMMNILEDRRRQEVKDFLSFDVINIVMGILLVKTSI